MIDATRVRRLNSLPSIQGSHVLYWMQASQRTRYNHALEYAIARANDLHLPMIVGFGVADDYPEANLRHYAFMLQGLRDIKKELADRGIPMVVLRGNPPHVAVKLARDSALVVCDRGYLRHQKQWRDHVADHAGCEVVEVETDAVVPVEEASDYAEFAARTLRPKIHALLPKYLVPLVPQRVRVPLKKAGIESDLDIADVDGSLAKLKIDRTVMPSRRLFGGEKEGQKLLRRFLRGPLAGYDSASNDPALAGTSMLGAYLHFGQLAPLEIALKISSSNAPAVDRESYLEQLIVRRELSMNFVNFNAKYDSFDGLPRWARQALAAHVKDKRPYIYKREQLENAQTHDPYWNAAQTEMLITGYMHNYMRMYWGKKILEWGRSPRRAYEDTLYLNNKYFLCGRDPNSYASVAWLYGQHDRPWTPRPIFGTIRYMNDKGLERKFDMDRYMVMVEKLQRSQT
jgi:deoxyribodipyrimidine photo-lyase